MQGRPPQADPTSPCQNLLALGERAGEEVADGATAIRFELARASAAEVDMLDDRQRVAREFHPVALIPLEPGVLRLVEDVERLVAELGKLRAPPGAGFDGFVFEDFAEDVKLLPLVDVV